MRWVAPALVLAGCAGGAAAPGPELGGGTADRFVVSHVGGESPRVLFCYEARSVQYEAPDAGTPEEPASSGTGSQHSDPVHESDEYEDEAAVGSVGRRR